MPKRIAVQQVHVFRDKKRQIIKPGELFDFTDDEIAELKAAEANGSGSDSIIRKPINEGGGDPVANARGAKGKSDNAVSDDL